MRNNGKKDAFSIISIAVALLMIFFIGSALISVVTGGISYIPETVKSEEIWFSVKTSLITATISTALCVFISIPSSYAFTRTDMPFRRISELIMELMVCLPYIVLGLCLLILFSSEFGKALKELGFQVVFDVKGIVIAQFFVNFPYAMKMVKTAFMQVDRRLEIIAGMLGASKWKQLTTIILPLSRNALISMIVLVWSRAIGEFGATLMLVGITRMKTETLPGSIYLSISTGDTEMAMAAATIMLCIAMISLTVINRLNTTPKYFRLNGAE